MIIIVGCFYAVRLVFIDKVSKDFNNRVFLCNGWLFIDEISIIEVLQI